MSAIDQVPQRIWETLSQRKIYFGHQSVGVEIVRGIEDVMARNGNVQLNIVETMDPPAFDSPLFAHSRVGRNTDPDSKIEAFRQVLDSGVGEKADVAFFKFCFVDIRQASDIEPLFDHYSDTVASLKKRYPSLQIIHVTVPLTTITPGIKGKAKRTLKALLRRPGNDVRDNAWRNEYNRLLIDTYKGKDPICDLATVESTFSDGNPCKFLDHGDGVPHLVPGYTYDGGHLNEEGRIRAARELLLALAGTV